MKPFAVVWADTLFPTSYHVVLFDTFDEASDWAIMNPTYISEVVPTETGRD